MTPTAPSPERPAGSRFRRDVEGLRALAVTLVLVHHAGIALPGAGFLGVDVFFVVSGFVITMQLLREVDEEGRISLLRFYGRRAKRLLPGAAVVLVVTALASWLMVSRVRWETIAGDIAGSALYVVNWVFAARSVDYQAEDLDPSPVLHYWSLAVEEQFYIVWPLVILGLAWLARTRARQRARRAVRAGLHRRVSDVPGRGALALGMLVLIVLPSLIWSLVYTAQVPERAFFVTTTRFWELGVGALVAIGAASWERWWGWFGAVLGWLGLIAIGVAAVVFDTSTPWPGWAALVPVLGTAAVIAGGFGAARWGPQAVLGRAPLVWVGGMSYSLYLWHWPALRVAEWQWGDLDPWAGALVVLASVLPAWLCYRLVERPVRYAEGLARSPRFALSVGLNASLVALLAGVLLGLAATSSVGTAAGGGQVSTGRLDGSPTSPDAGREGTGRTAPGLPETWTRDEAPEEPADPGPTPPTREVLDGEPLAEVITPDPVRAAADAPALVEDGCQVGNNDSAVGSCEIGDPDGTIEVALVGDSKAGQWVTALDAIGRENGWRVIVYTKSACAFTDALTVVDGEDYGSCRAWGQALFEHLSGDGRPDVLLTSAVRGSARGAGESPSVDTLVAGYVSYWEPLAREGVQVIALSDTPQPGIDGTVYECVAEHPEDHETACSWAYTQSFGSQALSQAVAAMPADTAHYVDLDPWICPEGTCDAVHRNLLTYRQGSHLTATFVTVLAEPLAQFLVPLVGRAPETLR